jgi:hypothetical protein
MAVCAEPQSISAQHKQWLFAQNCYHYLRSTSNGCLRRTAIIICATQAMAVCAELQSLSTQHKQWLYAQNCHHYLRNASNACLRTVGFCFKLRSYSQREINTVVAHGLVPGPN